MLSFLGHRNLIKLCNFNVFITAVCFLFLINSKQALGKES